MRVGTRSDGKPLATIDKDHPHACGDKVEQMFKQIQLTGSSPCVWGQD